MSNIVLSTPTETLLHEINELKLTQTQVAKTYSLVLYDSHNVDWSQVNRAIMARWSKSGLERIKQMAWKMASDNTKQESK